MKVCLHKLSAYQRCFSIFQIEVSLLMSKNNMNRQNLDFSFWSCTLNGNTVICEETFFAQINLKLCKVTVRNLTDYIHSFDCTAANLDQISTFPISVFYIFGSFCMVYIWCSFSRSYCVRHRYSFFQYFSALKIDSYQNKSLNN